MASSKCDLTNPDFTYSYCPSYAAAVLFAVLFSCTTAGHVYQAIQHRKPFAGILIMGGIWEVLGYIIRTTSIHNPFTSGLYTAQMLLILLAPLWINAFIYMLVGRMIHFFLEDDRIFGIKARRITLIFVIFDITAFLVQGTGGSMTSSDTLKTALTGLHVYTAGVALQILFNAVFLAIVGRFHKIATSTSQWSETHGQAISLDTTTAVAATNASVPPQLQARQLHSCKHLLYLVYGVIGLIFFRNFYRLAEFASGLDSTIVKHEWYAYVFDAVPMLAAMIVINGFHPGGKLQGPRCDFSEENQARKQARKERKAAKKSNGEDNSPAGIVTSLKKVPNIFSREIVNDSSA